MIISEDIFSHVFLNEILFNDIFATIFRSMLKWNIISNESDFQFPRHAWHVFKFWEMIQC